MKMYTRSLVLMIGLTALNAGAQEPMRPWGPEQAIGKPNTVQAGDILTTWASLTPDDQDEWLVLHYTEAIRPAEIHIYETYNPGAIYRITAMNAQGGEIDLWKGKDPTPPDSTKGVSEIVPQVQIKTNRERSGCVR